MRSYILTRARNILTRAETFVEVSRYESSPGPTELISFFLNLSWLGYYVVRVLQTDFYRLGGTVSNDGYLLFLVSMTITCALLIKSRDAFIFAVVGIAGAFWLPVFMLLDSSLRPLFFLVGVMDLSDLSVLIALFLTLLISLCLVYFALWFQAVKSRIWARRALLTVQATLLTLSLLMLFKPSGLAATPGGMTLAIAVVTVLSVTVSLVVAIWYTQSHDDKAKSRIYWAAFTVQMIMATVAIYYYAVSPEIRHFGEPVNVRELKIGGRSLSRPFVEEEVAYLASADGRLLAVNLLTGQEKIVAHIPILEPAAVGLPQLILPKGGARMTEGLIARQAQDTLSLRYVYSPRTHAGEFVGEWTMDVSINQKTGQVAWQLLGYAGPVTHYAVPVYYAGIGLYPPPNVVNMRIEGAGIETVIAPRGDVLWTWAGQGWLLAGTNHGVLYIIDAGARQ